MWMAFIVLSMASFFDPTSNSQVTIACQAPEIFMLNFPSPTLVLVTGIAKYIFQSFDLRVVKSRNMWEHGVRQYVIKMENLVKSHLANGLLKVPMGRELIKVSNLWCRSEDRIPAEDVIAMNIPQVNMDLTLLAGFGTDQVSVVDCDAIQRLHNWTIGPH